jgi:hypothetical protein
MRLSLLLPVPGGTKWGGGEVVSGVMISPLIKGDWSIGSNPVKDLNPKYLTKPIK